MQGGILGGHKHWTLAEVVPVYSELARFFIGTVPLEGGQLVIVGRINVVAGDTRQQLPTGTDDHGALKIVVTVADE